MPSAELYARLERRLERQLNRLNDPLSGDESSDDEDSGGLAAEPWTHTTAPTWAPAVRFGCAAAALGRQLYLFGGVGSSGAVASGGRFNDVAVFDLEARSWSPVQCTGTPPPPVQMTTTSCSTR